MKKKLTIYLFSMLIINMIIAQPGTIDNSFGTSGFVFEKANIFSDALCMAVQNDGKIIVAGTTEYTEGNFDVFLLRYNMDGSLSNSLIKDIDNKANYVSSIHIQDDGKILLTGYNSGDSDGFVIRVTENFVLDNSFGSYGVVKIENGTGTHDFVRAMDMVLYYGEYYISGYLRRENITSGIDQFIVKLLSNGYIDNSFNNGDLLVLDAANTDNFNSSLILNENSLFACGNSFSTFFAFFDLFKVNLNGSVEDVQYSSIFSAKMTVNEFILLDNHKMVAVGNISIDSEKDNIVLAVFDEDGKSINFFGEDWYVTHDLYNAEKFDIGNAIIALPNGSMFIAGSKYEVVSSWESSFVLGVNADATLNTSFGQSPAYGITNWNIPGNKLEKALDLVFNPVDNMIYVVGKTYKENDEFLYMTRLTSDYTAAVNEQKKSCQMSIVPNPTVGSFTISFDEDMHKAAFIQIYTLSGAEVYTAHAMTNDPIEILNLNLSGGMYIIKATIDHEVLNTKLFVIDR